MITRRVDRNNSAMLWLLRATAFLCVLANAAVPNARPPPSQRTFNSSFVEALIASYTPRLIDPDLATIFSNTFPNTLDTTIVAASESAFCARTRSCTAPKFARQRRAPAIAAACRAAQGGIPAMCPLAAERACSR
jgi:hypothetical protein